MSHVSVGRVFKWIGLTLLALIVILAALVYFEATDAIRQVAGQQGTEKLGRKFAINGAIKIDWSWDVWTIHLGDITLANDDKGKEKDPNMVDIGQLDFKIRPWDLLKGEVNLPEIEITKPKIVLEKYDADNANWQLPALSPAKAAVPDSRSSFPIIGSLAIHDGSLTYRDDQKKLDVTLALDTAAAGGGEKGDFKISGNGTLQGKKFELKAQGGSLQMMHDTSVDYPLYLDLKMGATHIMVDGTFKDPVKMEGVDTKLALSGDNLADLFYLTTIPLPPTPAYSIAGHLTKTGNVWTFENFKGRVGGSDLEGHLTYDISQKRNFMKAELISRKLDMKDLAGFVGGTPEPRAGEGDSAEQKKKADDEKNSNELFPAVPIDLSRLRAIDMDVSLKAEKILAPGLPIENMDVRVDLKDGVMHVDPLKFGVAEGAIDGKLLLDGTKDVPHVKIEMGLQRLNLKQFFTSPALAQLSSGRFGGRFDVEGNGRSLAEVMGDSDGRITMVMAGGQVSELIIDAAGLDLGGAAPLLLDKDKPTKINCAVADFNDKDGIMTSQVFVIDTSVSNVLGKANINLKTQRIDAQITANPKNPTISIDTAINIEGNLKKPSIGLDPLQAAERGGAAALLSVFLTPLGAIIPFIELGLGKDSDCGALIQKAQAKSGNAATPVAVPAQ